MLKKSKVVLRTIFLIVILIFLILTLKKPTYTMSGVVEEIHGNTSVLITQLDEKDNPKEGDLYVVKTNKEELKIGDMIIIHYDGIVAESYPAQINNVYKITKRKE